MPSRVPRLPEGSVLNLRQALAPDAAVTRVGYTDIKDTRRFTGELGSAACELQYALVVSINDTHARTYTYLQSSIELLCRICSSHDPSRAVARLLYDR